MDTRGLRCRENVVRIDLAETSDVLGHRPVKQLDVLRQITQVGAEFVLAPREYVRAIKADGRPGVRGHLSVDRAPQLDVVV